MPPRADTTHVILVLKRSSADTHHARQKTRAVLRAMHGERITAIGMPTLGVDVDVVVILKRNSGVFPDGTRFLPAVVGPTRERGPLARGVFDVDAPAAKLPDPSVMCVPDTRVAAEDDEWREIDKFMYPEL